MSTKTDEILEILKRQDALFSDTLIGILHGLTDEQLERISLSADAARNMALTDWIATANSDETEAQKKHDLAQLAQIAFNELIRYCNKETQLRQLVVWVKKEIQS